MAYSWTNNLPDGVALLENSAIAPLATLTADDGTTDAVSYGIGAGSDGYGNALFKIDNNGVLSPTSYLEDYELGALRRVSVSRHFSAIVNAYNAEGDVVASRLFVLTLGDVDEFETDWVGTPPTGIAIPENNAENFGPIVFNAADGDGTADVTYSLSGGDAAYFNLDANTGGLRVKSSLDFEDTDHGITYSVIVNATSTDGSDAISTIYVLTVTNVDEAETAWVGTPPTGIAIPENNAENLGPIVFNATDGDAVAVTYSLSGTDADYFNLDANTGGLYLKSSLDFEDSHGVFYSVTVNATSTDGSDAISTIYVLTVTNVDEAVAWQTNPTGNAGEVLENIAIGTSVATFSATDPEGTEVALYGLGSDYGFDGGHQDDYFNIDISTGELTIKSVLDFEEFTHYTLRVLSQAAVGNKGVAQQIFILTLTDVAEDTGWVGTPPAGITIDENNPENFGHILFNATDADGATVTYSLEPSTASAPNDAAYFNIDADTGGLFVKSSLDFEDSHGPTYSVIVNATSTDGSDAISTIYVLTVTNVDEAVAWQTNPTGNAGEVLENIAIGTALATFSATDPEGAGALYGLGADYPAFGLDGGSQGQYFSLDFRTGELTTKSELDFEDLTHYTLLVLSQATDKSLGTEVISHIFILTIADQAFEWESGGNPTGIAIDENNPENFGPIVFNAVDSDGDTVTYSLEPSTDTAPNDADYFSLNADTGELRVKSVLNFEDPDHGITYSVIINATSTDGSDAISTIYVLTVTNVDEPVAWQTNPTGNAGEVLENIAIGTALATFSATDPEGAGTAYYGLGSYYDGFDGGHQDAYFSLDLQTGELTTKSVLDFENLTHYTILALSLASAGHLGVISELFILTLTDENESTAWQDNGNPSGAALAENNTVGVNVADFGATDGDGVAVTYSLSGNDNVYFEINTTTGVLTAKSAFDFEDNDHGTLYSVVVNANSLDDSNPISRLFILTINDVDESGGGLAPDPTTPDQPVGINGKVLFDPTTETIGGINDGIGNDGLIIIGNDLVATQYSDGAETNLILNNIENVETSFVGYTDADGNTQNHWFFVRDDATDNTGHIVFDADGLDVNLESLANGGATTTPDQINLLAGLNFGNDGDFAKPDDLNLDLNGNNAASLTHDQFLALIGGSNNIDFI